jgi:hypothetical protein
MTGFYRLKKVELDGKLFVIKVAKCKQTSFLTSAQNTKSLQPRQQQQQIVQKICQ